MKIKWKQKFEIYQLLLLLWNSRSLEIIVENKTSLKQIIIIKKCNKLANLRLITLLESHVLCTVIIL